MFTSPLRMTSCYRLQIFEVALPVLYDDRWNGNSDFVPYDVKDERKDVSKYSRNAERNVSSANQYRAH